MKLRLGFLSAALLTLSVFSFPSLAAAVPADAPAGNTAEQRLQQRIAEQKLALTSKEVTRYTSKCVGAQGVFREIQNKLGPVAEKRLEAYGKIDAKLWIAIGRLKLAGKDTFKLEAQRAEYAKKVAAYSNTLNQYRQTLDDIAVINCEADVTGFMSLVSTARQYHESLRAQSNDINSFVVNDIKATLSGFVTELQPKASTEQ